MFNVPIGILLYSLHQKKVNQVRVYLYLKYMASGNIKLTDQVTENVCSQLGCCKKTFKTHLKWLLHKKWVSFNSNTRSLHIKGYKRIAKQWHYEKNQGVGCYIEQLINFRPFCYGATISWARLQKHCKDRVSKRFKGHFSKNTHRECMYDLPNRYLAKILNLDYTTVSKYRTIATIHGYIDVKHNYWRTNIPGDCLESMKGRMPDIAGRFFALKGFIVEQLPSTIDSPMSIKRKRLFGKNGQIVL
ncbi:hypothetical protein EYV94_27540 [Puteibacter caeruleilacunae]|nr:hypothetical protein EYV94_27540 [Puteibacter caeruleilacunae]